MDVIPSETRRLRACLLCNLIKSLGQFKSNGCDNCDTYLRMKGSVDRVYECTSTAFSGMIGSVRPHDNSWVCKWLRMDQMVPGVYAVSVQGKLPDEIQLMLEQKGLTAPQNDHIY